MLAALFAWAEGPLSFIHSSAGIHERFQMLTKASGFGSISQRVPRSLELVVMRAAKKKKATKKSTEAAESEGEAIQSGDEVVLVSRTGCYINAEEKSEDIK